MTTYNPATGVQTRAEYEAEQARLNRQVQIGVGGVASQTITGGNTANDRLDVQVRPRVEAGYAADVDYSKVTVNGMAMARDQYLRLVEERAIPRGAVIDDPTARRHAAEAKADPSFTDVAPANAEGNDEDEGNKSTGDKAVFTTGQLALDAARAELGADTVEALVGEAVHSGDLEAVKTALADGNVSAEQVGKVYAAYVASAQSIIADTGMSVETMSEVLGEDDLRSARDAVVKGDVSRVQDLAGKAIETLATLPETDPAAFEAYVDRRFPDLATKVENGKTMVATSQGWLPFDSLVRSGLLQKATLVPNAVTWPDEE